MAKTGEQAAPLLPSEPCYGVPAPFQSPYRDEPPAYVLLPAYPRRRRRRGLLPPCHCCPSLLCSFLLLGLLLAAAAFFLWPSDPELRVISIRLDRVRVSTEPLISLDVSLGLVLRIRNLDFYALDYDSIVVSIWYRGSKLGFVTSGGGHVRARGVSYVDADLHLNGIEVISDAFYLIEDLLKGSIPFVTITEVKGQLHVLSFDIPIQERISCAVQVNPQNQTVICQDCYPE